MATSLISVQPVVLSCDTVQTNCYELVVLNPRGTHVVLQEGKGEYGLPVARIPPFTRPAEKITSLLRTSWNARTTLLWSSRNTSGPDSHSSAALEVVDDAALPAPLKWAAIDNAVSRVAESQATLIQGSQTKALKICFGPDPEPFSRLGWIHRLTDWVNGVTRPVGTKVRDFTQYNGGETFSLVRFETDSKPLWFKAVGEPNLRECSITLLLARLFPDYLPKVLASDLVLHGWVMADAGGVSLNEIPDPCAWQKTLTTLAHLQIDSLEKTDELLAAGCRDLRFPALLQLVDPFLETMVHLMMQQPKVPPPSLTRQELRVLGETLKDALHFLGDLQIPDTLGHKDFNPGNIIVGPERCIFIDWAEAYVGHPFFTFEYFMAYLRRTQPESGRLGDKLKSCYSEPWRAILPDHNVSEALLFSPLAAVFAYAAADTGWRDQERLRLPRVPAYLRSLTRRMKREVDLLQQRRVECLR